MTAISDFSTPGEKEIKIVRSFAGRLEQVWAAWTQAEHLKHWWGPEGLATPICEVDFRPGGHWFYCFEDAEGNRYCGKMVYREIEPQRRFSGLDVFTDDAGNSNDDLPQAHTSYEFEEDKGVTIVSNVTRYASKEARDQVIEMGVEAGVKSTFSKLDKYLASLA